MQRVKYRKSVDLEAKRDVFSGPGETMAIDYKSAGVDIEKGDQFVEWLKTGDGQRPHEDKILGGIGGFASLFRFDFPNIEEPCLVSATDGIGTKLKLGIELDSYEGLGQDLVAMCANDLVCTGAQPLFFLDYFATSKLELSQAKPFLKGVRSACHESLMALIGGETAEMPGIYQPREFDAAGFAVGVVDRKKTIGPDRVKENMVVWGIESSGFHSNGYSLIRKLFDGDYDQFGAELLKPTNLYVKVVLDLVSQNKVAAAAHITGGGMSNVSRILPKGMTVEFDSWTWPEIFKEAQKRGDLTDHQMLETFNCGIGMALLIEEKDIPVVQETITRHGFKNFQIGRVQ